MGASFEFLTAQNNFSSNACATGPQGEGEKNTKNTATKGEVSVGDGFGVAAAPWQGSVTLTCPNLSSPGRAVINY